MKAVKIEQAESKFAQKLLTPLADALRDLNLSFPERYHIRISLLDATGRKKRSNASIENWSPESGRIEISFEQRETAERIPAASTKALNSDRVQSHIPRTEVADFELQAAECELINALVRAESRPGWTFVPLRKFRDEILSTEHLNSMQSDTERQNVLRSAIDKKLVLVGRVPNPRAPEFPVTTIRVNRLMPQVQRILGGGPDADLDFRPVEIPGEPLSTTILRERR